MYSINDIVFFFFANYAAPLNPYHAYYIIFQDGEKNNKITNNNICF